MRYLLDTDVLSASAPTKVAIRHELQDWLIQAGDRLFLSTITMAEIAKGVAGARRAGATAKADTLHLWLETIEHLYGERILPFDRAVARRAGRCSMRRVVTPWASPTSRLPRRPRRTA